MLRCKLLMVVFISSGLLLSSCENQSKQPGTEDRASTLEDSLYKSVIKLHDEVMPKIGKLQGYEKEVSYRIDSLEIALKGTKNEVGHDLKKRYEQLRDQLAAANKQMDDWMDSFKPDPKFATQAQTDSFWMDEHAKTLQMKNAVISAIDSAKVFLEN